MTNLQLSVVNVHSAILKSVINVIATIPQLVSNPANAIAMLLGGVTGQGGLMQELEKSPIEIIAVQATAGAGRINLQTATVQSSAFKADAAGTVMLAAVLNQFRHQHSRERFLKPSHCDQTEDDGNHRVHHHLYRAATVLDDERHHRQSQSEH